MFLKPFSLENLLKECLIAHTVCTDNLITDYNKYIEFSKMIWEKVSSIFFKRKSNLLQKQKKTSLQIKKLKEKRKNFKEKEDIKIVTE